jgi:Pyrimidine dimer DNA glycosylase
MQTFLPYPDFLASAETLDMRRLGSQRKEAYQILRVLAGIGKRTKNGLIAWQNHPAVRMWRGSEIALLHYAESMCDEWIRRGYNDTTREKVLGMESLFSPESSRLPVWFGDPKLHISHQANLVRKKPEFYIPKFGAIDPMLPYVWPA